MLFYLGSTLHGGGTNTTSDEWRRGMFFGFDIGWLRTEENMFFTVPIDEVRKMPVRYQELLGYKAHRGIGVVDVGRTPEMAVEGIEFRFGVGSENKSNSSSWILKEWKYPTERRVWGEFSDLFQDEAVRVGELIIELGNGTSHQRHFKRDEIWFVSKGECEIKHGIYPKYRDQFTIRALHADESFTVRLNEWHQIVNRTIENCHIIEI